MDKLQSLNAAAFAPMEVNAMIQIKGGYGTGSGAREVGGNLIKFSSDTIDMTDAGPILRAFDQNGRFLFELLDL